MRNYVSQKLFFISFVTFLRNSEILIVSQFVEDPQGSSGPALIYNWAEGIICGFILLGGVETSEYRYLNKLIQLLD